MNQWLNHLKESLDEGQFIKLTLSKPRPSNKAIKNVYIRWIELKKGRQLSFTYRYATKDIVKNHPNDVGIDVLREALQTDFYNAHLLTTTANYNFEQSKKGKIRMQKTKPTQTQTTNLQHNKAKKRWVDPDRPYLHHLGITNAKGQVLKNRQAKYKQINKYLEIIDNLLKTHTLPKPFHIVDMGSGRGYLTFALYDYLVNTLQKDIKIIGVELRPHLVNQCNDIAKQVGFEQLQFIAQDINDFPPAQIDMLIALHACDIATDIAIAKGILSEAALVVVAPCCHKQIRKQMNSNSDLQPILKHGILEERQAEMITDGIRSLLLEGHGYHSKVFEFISSEHTSKNLMITASKSSKSNKSAFEQVEKIKQQFGIEYHYLERLL